MGGAANKPAHITRGNVIDDLAFPPEKVPALKFKAELYRAILKYAKKYSQKELQVILGEPQPRVSELLNAHCNRFFCAQLRPLSRLFSPAALVV